MWQSVLSRERVVTMYRNEIVSSRSSMLGVNLEQQSEKNTRMLKTSTRVEFLHRARDEARKWATAMILRGTPSAPKRSTGAHRRLCTMRNLNEECNTGRRRVERKKKEEEEKNEWEDNCTRCSVIVMAVAVWKKKKKHKGRKHQEETTAFCCVFRHQLI